VYATQNSPYSVEELTYNLYDVRIIDGSELVEPPSGTIRNPYPVYKASFECLDYSVVSDIESKIQAISDTKLVYHEEEGWKKIKPQVFDKHYHLVVQSLSPWTIFGYKEGEYPDLTNRTAERLSFFIDAESMNNGVLYARPRRLDLRSADYRPLTQFEIECMDNPDAPYTDDF
jgi:hypothetical protein